ncbi:DUF371 domain-containing protein [Methanoplanus sp. FWC-SCC4]|uniref:DUF371 domain-containing protein n=2 Tax=Methanochimaera problematica TaxID=2609417 RepID=A0AA97FAF7_9EURY|nr:DUF371 domain-containing protein [Methanoplanus sp. FWC-SCC4]
MKATEIIKCRGHYNIRAEHPSTFEITKEEHLSEKGTCIIGIGADKGALDLSPEFKKILADDRSELTIKFRVKSNEFTILAFGSSKMTFENHTDMVFRRSAFVCGRTVAIYSDHVAKTFPREIIELLQKEEEMIIEMSASIDPEALSPSVPPLREFFHSFEEVECRAHKVSDSHQE